MKIACVIVAGGKGTRTGLPYNKALYPLGGQTVVERTLAVFQAAPTIDEIVLVASPDMMERSFPVHQMVLGGATRQDSVYQGLCAVSDSCELVLIHDAARPFVTQAIIDAVIADAMKFGSGVISTPVTDTIKRVEQGFAHATYPRDTLRAVQTPQAFRRVDILRAHEAARAEGVQGTDDASLYERYIGPVRMTEAVGAQDNRKLTVAEDLYAAQRQFTPWPRVGTGYDVHRLVEGRALVLCGVSIPYARGLLGHSDADVAIHALMDAMLGALGLGDIGQHFPDRDPAYHNIASTLLLSRVCSLIRDNGFALGNADITIVAQAPKLAPYIPAMRACLATTMNASIEQISVKATTTEGLGPEGVGEGISAQACVLLTPKPE